MVVRYLEQGGGVASEGLRKLIPCVEKTPVAAGVDGIFVKVHDDPLSSPVDGPTQWPLRHFEELLEELIAIAEMATDANESIKIEDDVEVGGLVDTFGWS
ncbi:hypothetical protein Vadar_009582 [Vaccinium darrowii]|uniref:Uncharacterized protein n=1 Tax=Vaccinium darrowii TaxID=229202 RepID=A0ACB7YCN1_9ERIC|nr:hypothetical protein Vadar_009582 [Vaccinium darrowii]